MPLYEFYCKPCNTIFTFYAKTAGVNKMPCCPRCAQTLERRMSLFAFSQKLRGPEALPLKPSRAEEGMRKLRQELDRLRDKDPKEAERFKKKFEKWAGVMVDYNVHPRLRTVDDENDSCQPVSRETNEPLRDEAIYEL